MSTIIASQKFHYENESISPGLLRPPRFIFGLFGDINASKVDNCWKVRSDLTPTPFLDAVH